MSQRLNIEIHSNGECIANAYYHWSGYTRSAFELTAIIIAKFDEVTEENQTLRAVRLFELTGARLTSGEEYDALKKIAPDEEFEQAVSRSDGLIGVTEKGIGDTRLWEEARVEINIDNKTINFQAWSPYTKEQYIDYYSKEEFEKLPDWKHSYGPFDNIPFDQVVSLYNYVSDVIKTGHYSLKVSDDEEIAVIGFIE